MARHTIPVFQRRTTSVLLMFAAAKPWFYWLAVLATFALGTAAGDYIGEQYVSGFLKSLLLFAAGIAVVFVAHRAFKLNAILSFWIAYILTRPLGASIGDYLASPDLDGRNLGTSVTSSIFLAAILATVLYLSLTKRDQTPPIDPNGLDGTLAPRVAAADA